MLVHDRGVQMQVRVCVGVVFYELWSNTCAGTKT